MLFKSGHWSTMTVMTENYRVDHDQFIYRGMGERNQVITLYYDHDQTAMYGKFIA